MARNRNKPTRYPGKYDVKNYKDLRQGAADDGFWDDENELVDYQSKKKKKDRPRVPGCPGNDGGSHVYVWINYEYDYPWFIRSKTQYEIKVCCGCMKRGRGFRKKND